MQRSRTGYSMQNVRTQQAHADLMSYDDAIQILIAETELKLCRAEQRMSQQPSEANQKKVTCLQQSLAQQKQVQQQMQTINTQYRNDPGKQYGEKAKAMMRAMRPCN